MDLNNTNLYNIGHWIYTNILAEVLIISGITLGTMADMSHALSMIEQITKILYYFFALIGVFFGILIHNKRLRKMISDEIKKDCIDANKKNNPS